MKMHIIHDILLVTSIYMYDKHSGLAVKKMIKVSAGVIDADYRGNVGIVLFNFGPSDFIVNIGDRVAQLILEQISMVPAVQVEELIETERGVSGFGSTGVSRALEKQAEVDVLSEKLSSIVISDDLLFRDPPPREECSLCFMPMLHSSCGKYMTYQPCCGKILCNGCWHAVCDEVKQGNMKDWCPFCRVPTTRNLEEIIQRFYDRMELNDPEAFYQIGLVNYNGDWRLTQDFKKALKLFVKASELGSCRAHCKIADMHILGEGVTKDYDKALHHYKLAAIGGHEEARHNVGLKYLSLGDVRRGMKHCIYAANAGYEKALSTIREGYENGYVSKKFYSFALQVSTG